MSTANGRASKDFTATEKRILAILGDGESHLASDVFTVIDDELAAMSTLHVHVCNIRKKLAPKGQDILFHRFQRKLYLRQVRRLHGPD